MQRFGVSFFRRDCTEAEPHLIITLLAASHRIMGALAETFMDLAVPRDEKGCVGDRCALLRVVMRMQAFRSFPCATRLRRCR